VIPGIAVGDKVWPEGEEAALEGLYGMDGAARIIEEGALSGLAAGFAEAAVVAGAVEVARLEFGLGEAEEAGGAGDVRFGEIDVAGDFAAFAATGLAGETDVGHAEAQALW